MSLSTGAPLSPAERNTDGCGRSSLRIRKKAERYRNSISSSLCTQLQLGHSRQEESQSLLDVDEFLIFVVLLPNLNRLVTLLQRGNVRLRLVNLLDTNIPHGLQQPHLLARAQERQRLRVLLSEGREQTGPQVSDLCHQLVCFLHHDGEAVVRQRHVDLTQHFTDAQPGGAGTDEQGWIDRRFEERKLPDLSLDVHAVPDLEESIRNSAPVAEQPVILRHAEIEHGVRRRIGRWRRVPRLVRSPGIR